MGWDWRPPHESVFSTQPASSKGRKDGEEEAAAEEGQSEEQAAQERGEAEVREKIRDPR